MKNLHEYCLITAAPAEILVWLAIFLCISGVVPFAFSIEAGNYPEVVRWIARLSGNIAGVNREHCAAVISQAWHTIVGGDEHDRTA